MGLKTALVCSTAIHVGFLTLRPGGLVPPRQTLYPLEVSYVILEPARPVQVVSPQVKRPESRPAPERREAQPAEPAKKASVPEPTLPKRQELAKPADSRNSPGAPPSVGAAALPEGQFAAIRHKELVREYLRKELHYPETSLEGVVRLRVTLLPDGSLKEAVVSEASDARLAAFTLRDARSAGPFPRFPKEMRSSETNYEFLVQYRQGDSSL